MLRALAEADLPLAAGLLAEGFPARGEAGWRAALERLAAHARESGGGWPMGQLLIVEGEPVGVGLTPASLRHHADGRAYRLVNVSSLYVRPPHRWRAGLMLRSMVADRDAIYIDLTPSDEIRRMLPMLGFAPVSQGTWVAVLPVQALRLARAGRVHLVAWHDGDDLNTTDPPSAQLAAHRALGGVPMRLEHDEGSTLLVYARRRLRGLPAARLLYVGSHRILQRHLGTLARHLLSRGIGLLSWDARGGSAPLAGRVLRPGGVWYARGDRFEDRSDFIGSELCLLGL